MFFQTVLQRTTVQQEKSKSSQSERLYLPQFSSWKSLLHVCILERKNPIESSMKFNIFPSSFSPAALFLSKHISVFHQMAVECTFKKILLEQEYKKWCKSWDWRQPNSNINLLAVGTWARFLMSLVLQFPQAKRGKQKMAIPPRHGPCHLTGTVWEPYMAGSFLSLKFTMSPPPTSPPWLSNMKLTPLSSLVPHPLLFLLILLCLTIKLLFHPNKILSPWSQVLSVNITLSPNRSSISSHKMDG